MINDRIEKAIEIINYAIQNRIAVKEASVRCGYANTYVKNIKAIVYEKYENSTLEDELFFKFNEAYKKYRNENLEWKHPPRNKEAREFYNAQNKEKFEHSIQGNLFSNQPIEIKTNPDFIKTIATNGSGEKFKLDVNENNDEATAEWISGGNYPQNSIKTLDELLTTCKVDLNIWKVKNYVVNKKDVTAIINKIPRTFQNFQIKAWLEKDKLNITMKAIGEIFIDIIKNYKPPIFNVKPQNLLATDEKNLLEVSIFDLHFGKLAWGGETFENYDTKIARERFLNAIETLMHRASGFKYNRILFPVGNDFFNSDTIYNTTTKGTPQDEDLRWKKTFKVGVRLLIDAINLLKQSGVFVDVVVIPGNHDEERSYYMGSVLEAWFNNDPMVGINNGASPRKYYRYGKVLIGLTHGSEEKESSLPLLMATDIESKPMWSETIYHEWHVGHIHRKRNVAYSVVDNKKRTLNEDLGVIVRYLSSLTGTEEWHHKKGFVGSIKAADAFIWNDELGLIAHLNSNLVL